MAEESGRPETTAAGPPASAPMQIPRHVDVALRSFGQPNATARQFDFLDDSYEWRRLFAELLGTFFLVLVAAGAGMINARFGGHVIGTAAQVVAPALMVMAVILFMGGVSGAHLNPAVSLAFAMRGNFPWRRVPSYILAQLAGAVLATLTLWAFVGRQGPAGLALPGPGISTGAALLWEALLTTGLVSVILGTASGAQQLGPIAAFGVGSYIALAGLFGGPVSGASMNPARSLGPALVLGDWTSWWAYLAGPLAGAVAAVGIAFVLRGPGGGTAGTHAAQGTLGTLWRPGRIGSPDPAPGQAGRRRRRIGLARLRGAADAGLGGRPGGQPRCGDGATAASARPVPARGQPLQRRVDDRQVRASLAGQGGGMLALEGDGRALRVVLIVGVGRLRRLDDPAQLPLQPGEPVQRAGPFRREQLARAG